MDRESSKISALDFDIVRSAYRLIVGDNTISDAQARQYAMDLVRDLTDFVDVDDDLIDRIIR